MRFFRNAPKNLRDTRAHLQELIEKLNLTLKRFFKNAPKISAKKIVHFFRNECQKFLVPLASYFRFAPKQFHEKTCAFLQECSRQGNPRNTRAFLQECFQTFGDPLVVSSGTRQKIRETLMRFLRNASTKSARHSCVFSVTRQNDRDTLARLFRNAPQKTIRETSVSFFRNAPRSRRGTSAFLQERTKKFARYLARFFRNAPIKSARHTRISAETRQKYP